MWATEPTATDHISDRKPDRKSGREPDNHVTVIAIEFPGGNITVRARGNLRGRDEELRVKS